MKYLITYSGFMGDNPISGTLDVESISITGCIQNFTNKMRNKGVDIKKLSITEIEKKEKDESPY